MGRSVQGRGVAQPLASLPVAEQTLSDRDLVLGQIIASQQARWPSEPKEDAMWGLVRMVLAQQIPTGVACRLAERVKAAYPQISSTSPDAVPDVNSLRSFGLPERRAQCCVSILRRSDEIRAKVNQGQSWEEVLADIKGIGPWTISVFRIMVLRHPDVLPLRDVGLERAITNVYGRRCSVERLGEKWRPFRSVACWYLWRTLGNEQLG
jgi:DNA-3-methyladenine glycosylase II